MTILITGIAGFVGSCIAKYFREYSSEIEIVGVDNLARRGSENNILQLKNLGCKFYHGDVRNREDVEDMPKANWIIDCAANPSVLAGLDGGSLGLVNNNLTGTINLLEKCKREQAGFVMLSTSRVYSINELGNVPIIEGDDSFLIEKNVKYTTGFSEYGVSEKFSTQAPISLYGATKLASETMALEYHYTFGFPVWINRCGVIAGPGQFGKIDQGIFSFWIYQYLLDRPLSYIGFGGRGLQARDLFHPYDVFTLIQQQIYQPVESSPKVLNIGGGIDNTFSLAQMDRFCKENINQNKKINQISDNRSFDIPIYVTDYSKAKEVWGWSPSINKEEILRQIAAYASDNIEHIKRLS